LIINDLQNLPRLDSCVPPAIFDPILGLFSAQTLSHQALPAKPIHFPTFTIGRGQIFCRGPKSKPYGSKKGNMTIMTSGHISQGVGSTKSDITQQMGFAILYHLPKALSPLPQKRVGPVVENLLLPFNRLPITCS
jgi:hypothetical protein